MTRTKSSLPDAQAQLPFARPIARLRQRHRAGREKSNARARVAHTARPTLSRHHPVHVTTRLCRGLPPLRRADLLLVLRAAFEAGRERFGFRLVHFSIQNDHLHLLVECDDARSLGRGMKGLLVRIARALNRNWRRRGQVFADRYHAHELRTPREVRNALVYVLNNARKHIGRYAGIDPCSSGLYFDGWAESSPAIQTAGAHVPRPVVAARTWLLRVGWTRHGRIRPEESPRSRAG